MRATRSLNAKFKTVPPHSRFSLRRDASTSTVINLQTPEQKELIFKWGETFNKNRVSECVTHSKQIIQSNPAELQLKLLYQLATNKS